MDITFRYEDNIRMCVAHTQERSSSVSGMTGFGLTCSGRSVLHNMPSCMRCDELQEGKYGVTILAIEFTFSGHVTKKEATLNTDFVGNIELYSIVQ